MPSKTNQQRAQQAPPAGLLEGVRVLLLDDQAAERQSVLLELAQQAMRADGFGSASAALGAMSEARAAHDPYRIAILSHQSADMDGATLGAAIKADSAYRDTLLVMLDPGCSPPQADRLVKAGFSAAIAKPVNRRILLDTLTILCTPPDRNGALPFVLDGMVQTGLPSATAGLAGPGDAQETEQTEQADELEAMRDLFGASFAELAALYRDDVPKRLAALEAAARAEPLRLAGVIHSLSGSCASIGATRLAALCQDLELRCKAGLCDDFDAKLAAIKAEYDRIETKLRAIVQSSVV